MAGVELYDSVSKNDLSHVKLLVKRHKVDLNAKFQEVRQEKHSGMCPIHLAAFYGYQSIVDFFIQSGCDVNVTTAKFQRTPLHSATLSYQIPCMELLIQSGASVDAQDLFGNTPCHYAAEDGCSQLLKLLIQNGVNVDVQDVTHKTPLMKAVRNNRTDSVLHLLRAGADMNLIDSNSEIALHFAARNGFDDIIDVLLGSSSLKDVQNCWGCTPLMEALSNHHTNSLKQLIDADCDLNCQEFKTGNTALHLAVKKKDANLARVLLQAGARYDVYNHCGETALFDVVALNRTDILRLVIDFNCKLDAPLKYIPYVESKSAFQVAMERGHLNTCHLLSDLGYLDYSSRDFFYANYFPARPVEQDTALAWLHEALQQVASLRQLCRKVIRQCCDHQLQGKVEFMPVPHGLKNYILAQDGFSVV